MKFQTLLNQMSHGERRKVNVPGQINEIRAYISDQEEQKLLNDLIPILKTKRNQVFSFDLIVSSLEGKLAFKLNPLKSLIPKGVIFEKCFITITELTKIDRNGIFYFMIDELKIDNFLSIKSNDWCLIKNYKDHYAPLGGKQGSWFLDVLSLNEIEIKHPLNQEDKLKTINFSSTTHDIVSLKSLDKNWSAYSAKPNLLCRVLAVSKVKLTFKKYTNDLLAICNILVYDNSAYLKLTCFNEAAVIMNQEVSENDLLYIKGAYSYSQFVSQKRKYQLEPKKKINLGGTCLELKINQIDLKGIFKITNERVDFPKPVWSFFDVRSFKDGSCQAENIFDILGVVLSMGRLEREPMYKNNVHSGSFWIRMWLEIADRSTDETIFLKLYLNQKMRNTLENIIPGDAIIVSQLVLKSRNERDSFLESTNETSIFTSEVFHENKFKICEKNIKKFQNDCLYYNFNKWKKKLKLASICGFMFPIEEQIFKNILNISLVKKFQVQNQLKSLNFLALSRIVVEGKLQKSQHVQILQNLNSLEIENICSSDSNSVIGKNPFTNLPISVDGLRRDQVISIQRSKQQPTTTMTRDGKQIKNMSMKMVEILLEDCVLICEYYKETEVTPSNLKQKFEVEMYRFNSYDSKIPDKGVQFVLHGHHRRDKLVTPSPDEEDPSSQDIASILK